MLKNLTASMIIVWGLVILLLILAVLVDRRFFAASLLVASLYVSSVADDR